MDYFFIAIAVLFCVSQFVVMQFYQKSVKQTFVTGTALVIVNSATVALIMLCLNGFKIAVSKASLESAFAYACLLVVYNLLGLKVLEFGNVAAYSMFMMLGGMAFPFVYGVAFLKEQITACKILGMILLVFFMVLQVTGKKGKEKNGVLYAVFCICVFVINGSVSVVTKSHQINPDAVDTMSYLFLTHAMTVVLALILFAAYAVVSKIKKSGAKRKKSGDIDNEEFLGSANDVTISEQLKPFFKPEAILLCISLGAVMSAGTLFLLLAARSVPASVQYPVVSGGVIVLSALAGAVVFKDRLSVREIVAIAGAFLSTVLFAF